MWKPKSIHNGLILTSVDDSNVVMMGKCLSYIMGVVEQIIILKFSNIRIILG